MIFSRSWAMPSASTFAIKPIREFVKRYLNVSKISIDPFARNRRWATFTNDINPETAAEYHMDAVAFLEKLAFENVKSDLIILDPPYSPRQISECYEYIGRTTTMKDTQSALLYAEVRDAARNVLYEDGTVLSFGWNSVGMGETRRFEILEILLVCHGGAHNDTICMAERMRPENQTNFAFD